MAQPLNWFHQIKAARRVCAEGFPRCLHYLFSVGLFSPLPRSHWKEESISLSQSCSQRPKENKQYSTWYIKRREEKNILGKYQSTYFMIFKCHRLEYIPPHLVEWQETLRWLFFARIMTYRMNLFNILICKSGIHSGLYCTFTKSRRFSNSEEW